MKKITLIRVINAIPAWAWVIAFFSIVALAYILLNATLGFDQTAYLFR